MSNNNHKVIEGFSTSKEDFVLCLHNNGIDPIVTKVVKGTTLYYYKNSWDLFKILSSIYTEKQS